jgi:hypothetical protein
VRIAFHTALAVISFAVGLVCIANGWVLGAFGHGFASGMNVVLMVWGILGSKQS